MAEGSVDSDGRFGDTIDPSKDGRLEVRIPSGGGLKQTSRGLELTGPLGDKTLVKMVPVDDPAGTLIAAPTAASMSIVILELRDSQREILQALRDTFRMRTI